MIKSKIKQHNTMESKAKMVAKRIKKLIDTRNANERAARHTNILPIGTLITFDSLSVDDWINVMYGIYKLSIDDIMNMTPRFVKAMDTIEYEYYGLNYLGGIQ